ncbi:hypothetical protein ABW20_dc0101361 [Dactylellina cionopaga]|nr:hypothetical protein ABW20_dc0101361 [Dactylellina cionopaga]
MSTDEDALTYIFQGEDATLVLNVDPAGYILDPNEFSFATDSCYIYAEKVIIPNATSWTLNIYGKTFGIFCNTLQYSGQSPVTFNVSGANGIDEATDSKVLNGKNSGNFYLYVEDITDATYQYLNIRACGGNGGRGVSYVTKKVGGHGGNAGNGGNVNVVFGCTFQSLATSIHNNLASPWPQQAANILNSVLPTINTLTDASLQVGYTESQVDDWQSVISSYDTYATSLQGLTASLQKINDPPSRTGGHPSNATKTLAAELSTTIQSVLQSTQAPISVPAITDHITTLEGAINGFMKKGGSLEQTVVSCIETFPQSLLSITSDLSNVVEEVMMTSLGLTVKVRDITSHNIVNTNQGRKMRSS